MPISREAYLNKALRHLQSDYENLKEGFAEFLKMLDAGEFEQAQEDAREILAELHYELVSS